MSVRPREEEEELRRRGDQSDFWHLRRKAEEGPKSPPLFSFSRPTASISLPLLSPTRSLRLVSKTCLPQGIIPPLAAEGKRKTTRRGSRTHRMFGSESCPSPPPLRVAVWRERAVFKRRDSARAPFSLEMTRGGGGGEGEKCSRDGGGSQNFRQRPSKFPPLSERRGKRQSGLGARNNSSLRETFRQIGGKNGVKRKLASA